MQRDKMINVPMLIIGAIGCAIAFVLSELVLSFLSPLPLIIQAGLYMVFACLMCGLVILVSESVKSGGYVKHRERFTNDRLRAWLIFIPIAFAIGLIAQFLYGFAGIKLFEASRSFRGSYLVCDISGSMNSNDPDRKAIDSLVSYIDEVPFGEYLGVIVYSYDVSVLRDYEIIGSEEEREELKEYIAQNVNYDGGTNTQDALMEAINQIAAVEGRNPGIVILFSDGLFSARFEQIQRAARNGGAGREIPVNTIYYNPSPMGGYQLSTIAQITGGTYSYLSTSGDVSGVFTESREAYQSERLFLLNGTYGEKEFSVVRIALQAVFISIWCLSLGFMVVFMLDNKNLIRGFLYPRIALSLIAGIAFTALMIIAGYGAERFVRAIPLFCMVVIFIPTYKLTARG